MCIRDRYLTPPLRWVPPRLSRRPSVGGLGAGGLHAGVDFGTGMRRRGSASASLIVHLPLDGSEI
eukprot:8995850-Alexandrium_andersonii.AAC.1